MIFVLFSPYYSAVFILSTSGGHGIQEVSGSIPLISTKIFEIFGFRGFFLAFFQKMFSQNAFTDDYAEKSIERRFDEDLDTTDQVCVYTKLPKGFHIPTPVGNYSTDWAIAFNEGTLKHIYFVAEAKGTMESLNRRPIEHAKIACGKKFFHEISTSHVKYHDVDSYQSLLTIMNKL